MKLTRAATLSFGLLACQTPEAETIRNGDHLPPPAAVGKTDALHVPLVAGIGSRVAGFVTAIETAQGVEILISLHGAPPGTHTVHLHDRADCTGGSPWSDTEITGPGETTPREENRHLGLLGLIRVSQTGEQTSRFTVPNATMDGSNGAPLYGTAIVIYAGGGLGTRSLPNEDNSLACGVFLAQVPSV